MNILTRPDTTVVWEHYGAPENPPLLILHGLGSPPQLSFHGLLPGLTKSYYLIAPHMRGQAGNLKNGLDDPKKAFTLNYPNSVVEDIIALLDQLHIESIPTVGYSLGGTISILLAKTHAKRISSLTLLAPGIHPNEQIMIQHASQLMRKGLLPNIPRSIEPWMRPIIRYYGKKYHIMGEAEYYGIKEGIFSVWGDIVEQAVPHVNQPTQIIQGEKDTIVSVASSRWLHKQWPTSRLHILPEAGHGLHNESIQIMHSINAYIHKFVI